MKLKLPGLPQIVQHAFDVLLNRGIGWDNLSEDVTKNIHGEVDSLQAPIWGDCLFIEDIYLKWYVVEGATEYEVRTNKNFGVDDEYLVFRGNSLNYTVRTATERYYVFYIKAIDGSGKYSKEMSVKTLSNDPPLAPPPPVISEFFSSLWVEIQPGSDLDILGYNLYVTPCTQQGDPIGETEKLVYPGPLKVTYQAPSGSNYLVEVAAYDRMGEGERTKPIQAKTRKIDDIAQFAQTLRPPIVIEGDTLPILPNEDYPVDAVIYLTGNSKLYKNVANTWSDELGQNDYAKVMCGVIMAGAIGVDQLAAKAVTVDKLAAGSIEAYVAAVKEAFIDSAKIISLEANKLKIGGGSAPIPLAIEPTDTLLRFENSLIGTKGEKPIGLDGATRTDYGLIYNDDGSLSATLLPEGGVAIEEKSTENLLSTAISPAQEVVGVTPGLPYTLSVYGGGEGRAVGEYLYSDDFGLGTLDNVVTGADGLELITNASSIDFEDGLPHFTNDYGATLNIVTSPVHGGSKSLYCRHDSLSNLEQRVAIKNINITRTNCPYIEGWVYPKSGYTETSFCGIGGMIQEPLPLEHQVYGYYAITDPRNKTGSTAGFLLRNGVNALNLLSADSNVTIQTNTWYKIRLEFTENMVTAKLYNTSGILLSTLTSNDTTYSSGKIGLFYFEGSYADDLVIVPNTVEAITGNRLSPEMSLAAINIAKTNKMNWNSTRPSSSKNIAFGASVTCSSPTAENLARATDGVLDTLLYVDARSIGSQYIAIDLGAVHEINKIKVWHYYGDGRTYFGTKTEISEDGVTWLAVFDSTSEGEYAETAEGKIHLFVPQKVRYVRDYTNENSINASGHWVEVEVYEATNILVESNLALDGLNYTGWQPCINGAEIPGITSGTDLSQAKLQLRQTLSTTDPTVTPVLSDLTINITEDFGIATENNPLTFTPAATTITLTPTNLTKWQLEQGSCATPFVDGYRPPGNLQYQTNLSMLQSGTIPFTVWTSKTTFETGLHDAMLEVGGVLQLKLDGDGMEGYAIEPNQKYKCVLSWENGANTKLYVEGELWKAYDTVYTEAGDGIVRFGRFKDLENSVNRVRFQNTLIRPYAVPPETIAAWHSLDAPFFDPRESIDAGARPIYAPGVEIDETGAWGIANGIKQAGFGTDGKWMAGGGSVVADEEGQKIISPNGDYSLMDGNQLRFFKAGYPSTPFWYTKRVAYGVAESGDYIDLTSETGIPWEHSPKVITAIKNLQSYNPSYDTSGQYYESYADGITKEGFYVYGKNIIPGSYTAIPINQTIEANVTTTTGNNSNEWISSPTPSTTTKINLRISWNRFISGGLSTGVIKVYYRKVGMSWIEYWSSTSAKGTTTLTVSDLSSASYEFKVYIQAKKIESSPYTLYMQSTIHEMGHEINGLIASTGEVMWIAIEGGSD